MRIGKLLCHFTGNSAKWLINFGTKNIDEIAKEDNSTLGFIVLVLIFFVCYSFK